MTKVFLREKKLKNSKRGLYLDFYPPIVNPATQKPTRREHLGLYIYERPKNETERDFNKKTKMLAENIRSKRQLELQSGVYGFITARAKHNDFLAFFSQEVESKRRLSASTHYIWKATYQHFESFTNKNCRFSDVTEILCNEFRDYLLTNLAVNSAAAYFVKFKSVLAAAVRKNLLAQNPAKNVASVSLQESHKEFLSLEELQKLSSTPFKYEDLRRASLFSALTGLRFSDILKLTWDEIQHSRSQGVHIRFIQQKTGNVETLPVSEESLELLGERGQSGEKVFKSLKKQQCMYLPFWAEKAGIDKDITFHSFRHTFATLQLTLGTDIYTVSKMLGHKNLQTTQIYAKVIDERKREAANKIKLK
jgi:integrase